MCFEMRAPNPRMNSSSAAHDANQLPILVRVKAGQDLLALQVVLNCCNRISDAAVEPIGADEAVVYPDCFEHLEPGNSSHERVFVKVVADVNRGQDPASGVAPSPKFIDLASSTPVWPKACSSKVISRWFGDEVAYREASFSTDQPVKLDLLQQTAHQAAGQASKDGPALQSQRRRKSHRRYLQC